MSGVLHPVRSPGPLVIISQGWPSALVAAQAQGLGVAGAFFPERYHELFKLNGSQSWHPVTPPRRILPPDGSIFVLSGDLPFLQWCLEGGLDESVPLIAHVTLPTSVGGQSRRGRAHRRDACTFLRSLCGGECAIRDEDAGGATDARHLFGFRGLAFARLAPTLGNVVGHYLRGDVKPDRRVARSSLLCLPDRSPGVPIGKVLTHQGLVRSEGLFPAHNPGASVLCPIYSAPTHLAARRLTLSELLQVYSVPSAFASGNWSVDEGRFPFRGVPSADVYQQMFRQLWECARGGVEASVKSGAASLENESPSADARRDGAVAEKEEIVEEQHEGMKLEEEGEVAKDGKGLDDSSVAKGRGLRMTADTVLEQQNRPEGAEDGEIKSSCLRSDDPSYMGFADAETVTTCSESASEGESWSFELMCPLGPALQEDEMEPLTDEDSWGTTASDLTLLQGSVGRSVGATAEARIEQPCDRPEGGTSLPPNGKGPPYAVGEVVLCDVGNSGLRKAFIRESSHPSYRVRLDDGEDIYVSIGVNGNATFIPRLEDPKLAPDLDSPFVDLWTDPALKRGSYGMKAEAQRESLERVREEKEYAKAVKADDATVPVLLWNRRVEKKGVTAEARDSALNGFRKLGWRFFMRALREDSLRFLREKHGADWAERRIRARRRNNSARRELEKDRAAIANLMWHATQTDWFEYTAGSRIIHFRYPVRYQRIAREGVPSYFEQPGPDTRDAQPSFEDDDVREKVKAKIQKVIRRKYMLTTGIKIKSLIKYFAVPKGDDDIRLVYDATANKLNEKVWVPSFWLPTIDSLLRAVDSQSWMTDRDVGDMFLNFQLHPSVQPYTGVDLRPIYGEGEEHDPRWAFWVRNLMGFAASPYNSVLMILIAEEICRGNRLERGISEYGLEENPFQWARVRLNLPGSPNYDPKLSWIAKVRADGLLACDVHTFVDDERVSGPTQELTWQASHVLAAKQAYLGIQDAARKVRPCSQTPGAWAGAIVHISNHIGVCALTSEEKWAKLKEILDKWWWRLSKGELELVHKELLSDRGFLVYVTRTYPAMVPYLKGFHLTIESWRGGRDEEGWKVKEDEASVASVESVTEMDVTRAGDHGVNLSRAARYVPCEDEDAAAMEYQWRRRVHLEGLQGLHAPPSGTTRAVPRLKSDVAALRKLASEAKPPLRVVRPSMAVEVFYGFGDASGKQFGATLARDLNCQSKLSSPREGEDGLRYRFGVWTAEEQDESSNYKELSNLVETLTEEARAGRLRDAEVFLCTDNSVSEGSFYRGTSKSRKLHELVLKLRVLEMEFGLTIHLIHVAGTRMIAQGTDALSRGSLLEGVMAGRSMLSFLDLDKTAIERSPRLLDWVREWTQLGSLEPLTPEGWFEEGHGIVGGAKDARGVWIPKHAPSGRLHLWAPQPAVADAALEELLKSRHKRTDTFHVVMIPRLMTPRWRRLFNKACDFSFAVPPGTSFWPSNMHEPLWVGIVLPFIRHRPWCLKRAPLLVEVGRRVRRMFSSGEGDVGDILCKLLRTPKRANAMSEVLACRMLQVPRTGPIPVPRS